MSGHDLTLPERVTQHDPISIFEVGSTAHGISTGSDDLDLVAIVYDPWDSLHGLGSFGTSVYRTAAERTGNDDARSEPGDVDLVVHGLRKFCTLALKGNPSMMMLFWQEPIWSDEWMGPLPLWAFQSKRVIRAHIGYLTEQRERMMGRRGQKNVKRPELVERYGFDTKYAGHIVRLGIQGVEYGLSGRISVPMSRTNADIVRAVRNGHMALSEVERYATNVIAELETILHDNPLNLPERPDQQVVSKWLQAVYGRRLIHQIQEARLYTG